MRFLCQILLTPVLLFGAVTPPDTPAGKVFAKWLDAFNSGDRGRLVAYAEQYDPKLAAEPDRFLQFRENTGGFDLLRISKSEARLITGLVKERKSDTVAEFEFRLEGDDDHLKVVGMRVQQVPPPPEFAPARLSLKELPAAVDRHIAERTQTGLSGAVLVSRNGEVVVAKSFGLADREKNKAATLDTQFRLGSMNKMFTSVAILQLVQKGKLDLNAPLGKYLKDYPNQNVASKVTIQHLLTHTGGTGDIFGPEFNRKRLELKTLSDYVTLYGNREPEFEPGSQFRYSNYGYLLLGAIIEAVAGQSYYDYVRENIFKPAGMNRTDSLPETEVVSDRAVGYMRRDGKLVPNTDTLPWRGTSAGGGYSTVRDLHKFATALLNGTLLKKETLAEATRPHKNNYGYGFSIQAGPGRPVSWGHGGGAPGMNGELRVFPDSGWIVVALSNLDPPAAGQLADFIALRLPL